MSAIYSENATHRANLLAAEVAYQQATAGATTQAAFDAADIVRLRACLASAKANSCSLEPFVTALKGNHGLNS